MFTILNPAYHFGAVILMEHPYESMQECLAELAIRRDEHDNKELVMVKLAAMVKADVIQEGISQEMIVSDLVDQGYTEEEAIEMIGMLPDYI